MELLLKKKKKKHIREKLHGREFIFEFILSIEEFINNNRYQKNIILEKL